jgi:hypothetical protein
MAAKASTQREMQEQSIKARKHELFVEEEPSTARPRMQFREYLRQTPATPMSKNVKLMLWGSAAPVAFLFFAALLTSKGSSAKPPEGMVIPVNRAPASIPPAPVSHAPAHKRAREQAPEQAPAPAVVSNDATPEANATNPTEEKPKPVAKKKKGKGKGKNKKNQPKTEIAKTDETAKAEASRSDETAKGDEKAESTSPDAKSASSAKAKAPEPAPKPEKPKVSVFKKKKPPVFTYPKSKPGGEKKDETKP